MVQADRLLLLLSDIDGLYTADPRTNPAAQHIPVVPQITSEIEAMGGEPPPRLLLGRHADEAGGGAHCHPGPAARWRSRSARCPIPLPRSRPARAAPGFLAAPEGPHRPQALDRRQPGAARHAGGGCRRGAGPWRMAGRCCPPACAPSKAPSIAATRWSCAGTDGVALAQGLSALWRGGFAPHRRAPLGADRGAARLARPRRGDPPRRPGLVATPDRD